MRLLKSTMVTYLYGKLLPLEFEGEVQCVWMVAHQGVDARQLMKVEQTCGHHRNTNTQENNADRDAMK